MKVKPEIKEKIITAANALTAEGIENPTNDQVREHMGGGSLSHISPVMREWRESRKAEVVAALKMPADLKKKRSRHHWDSSGGSKQISHNSG